MADNSLVAHESTCRHMNTKTLSNCVNSEHTFIQNEWVPSSGLKKCYNWVPQGPRLFVVNSRKKWIKLQQVCGFKSATIFQLFPTSGRDYVLNKIDTNECIMSTWDTIYEQLFDADDCCNYQSRLVITLFHYLFLFVTLFSTSGITNCSSTWSEKSGRVVIEWQG